MTTRLSLDLAGGSSVRSESAHLLTPPRRPQINGKVERFNRTMIEEWAYATLYHSNTTGSSALPRLA